MSQLQSVIITVTHETRRKTSLPAAGRRHATRPRSRNDAAGPGQSYEERDWPRAEPIVLVSDRKRHTPALDQRHTHAAGALLQGASGISGGRPRGLSH